MTRWLLALIPTVALAGEASLTCTAPTQNEDGSAITSALTFNFYVSDTPGGPYQAAVTGATECAAVVSGLSDGDWYFVATAVNDQGTESDYSGEAMKSIVTKPQPPTMLKTVASTVYGISQSDDRLALYPIGTVPAGTPCDPGMTVNGLYQVDRAAVEFVGSVSPPVVFAECTGSGTS